MIDLTSYHRNILGYEIEGGTAYVRVQYNQYPDPIVSRYRISSNGKLGTYFGSELDRIINVYDDHSILLSREQIEENRKSCQQLIDM